LGVAAMVVVFGMACSNGETDSPTVIATDFDPKVDGFAFRNYNNAGVENLSEDDVADTFGENACESRGSDAGCVLHPIYEDLRVSTNRAMNGGHCEGMASLAALLYARKLPVTNFGAVRTFDLQLRDNAPLQRQIAKLFSYQLFDPTRSERRAWLAKGPAAIAEELTRAFSRDDAPPEMYTLAIYKRGMRAGHAITPYGVERASGGVVDVLVYDNNFPGERRVLRIDTARNTWSYVASPNPSIPTSLYEGDLASRTLGLVRASTRLEPQICRDCEARRDLVGDYAGARRVWVDGGAHLLLRDEAGRALGYRNGALVQEIAGADVLALTTETSLTDDFEDPIYLVPASALRGPLSIETDGRDLTAVSDVTVTVLGAGVLFRLNERQMRPFSQGVLALGANGRQVEWRSRTGGRVTLSSIVQLADASWELDAHVVLAPGESLDLGTDAGTGELRVQAHGDRDLDVYLEASRRAPGRRESYEHALKLKARETLRLAFHQWAGEGASIVARRDFESDGVDDASEQLPDAR
jgi:hypothetical protein